MDELSTGFRGAVVGGFRREDVMNYIERTDKQYHEETEKLQQQLTAAQTEADGLRVENQALSERNAELLERLGQLTLDTDEMSEQVEELKNSLTLQTAEVEAQSARAEGLEVENKRLTTENQKMQQKCTEYDKAKDRITEMELSAYRRAEEIKEDARGQLQKLRQESLELIHSVQQKLNVVKEQYKAIALRSQMESADMARKASEWVDEVDYIISSLMRDDTKLPDINEAQAPSPVLVDPQTEHSKPGTSKSNSSKSDSSQSNSGKSDSSKSDSGKSDSSKSTTSK